MNRRNFIRGSAALVAAPSMLLRPDATVRVTVGAPSAVPPIPPDFMGLGFEISSVARSGLLSPANAAYVQLVRALSQQGLIRVGGNTADYAHYSPGAPPVSTPYGTVVDDAVLKDLGGFLAATGWKLIWALNLGSGSQANAIDEARAVTRFAGSELLAFEIGNEPDLFKGEKHRSAGYGYDAWLADYRGYKAALRAQLPGIPFAGPDVAGKTDWAARFAADEGKDCVLLTHHYYREGQNPTSTIAKLLGSDPKLQPQLDQLRSASQRCGVGYRICEVNSFSGGGRPGVSDTMAAAVWALDYLWTLAANGCSGVNMETGVNQHGFISSYSPIGDDEQGHYEPRPEYYGLLAFRFAQGKILDVVKRGANPAIKAYAASPAHGTVRVTLINKSEISSVLHITSESERREQASLFRLTGPAANATLGVKLTNQEALRPREGQWIVELPAVSAAIVDINFATMGAHAAED
jgi:hypothetical protein